MLRLLRNGHVEGLDSAPPLSSARQHFGLRQLRRQHLAACVTTLCWLGLLGLLGVLGLLGLHNHSYYVLFVLFALFSLFAFARPR